MIINCNFNSMQKTWTPPFHRDSSIWPSPKPFHLFFEHPTLEFFFDDIAQMKYRIKTCGERRLQNNIKFKC